MHVPRCGDSPRVAFAEGTWESWSCGRISRTGAGTAARICELIVIPLKHTVIQPAARRADADRLVHADHVLGRFARQQQHFADIMQQRDQQPILGRSPLGLHRIDDLEDMQLLTRAKQPAIGRVDALCELFDEAPWTDPAEHRCSVLLPKRGHGLCRLRIVPRVDGGCPPPVSVGQRRGRRNWRSGFAGHSRAALDSPVVGKLERHDDLMQGCRDSPDSSIAPGSRPNALHSRHGARA